MDLKPYMKVCVKSNGAVGAVYEPHPFRERALPGDLDIGIGNDQWCWVFYDWCGNPVGILEEGMPDGEVVPMFTAENVWNQSLADYLNKENPEDVAAWYRSQENAKE